MPSISGIRTSIRTTSGSMVGSGLDGLDAVGRLGHHGDAVGCLEYHAESGPYQILVVGDEDPDRVGVGS